MRRYLWLLIPIFILINPVIAEDKLDLRLPEGMVQKYLRKATDDECLVAIGLMRVSGCGANNIYVPYVTYSKWKAYKLIPNMTMADLDPRDVVAQAIHCGCQNHKGSRLKEFRIKEDSGWTMVYKKPQKKDRVVKAPKDFT